MWKLSLNPLPVPVPNRAKNALPAKTPIPNPRVIRGTAVNADASEMARAIVIGTENAVIAAAVDAEKRMAMETKR